MTFNDHRSLSWVFATDTVPAVHLQTFDSVTLVVAGGTPPYACQVVDVQSDPNDETALRSLIPNGSCTIVGAPTGVKPVTPPFTYLVSVEAHDHADILGYPSPLKVTKRFQINVLVPEVVITTLTVKNGTCGQGFSDKIDVVDGIPPFNHRVVTALNGTTMLVGEPGTPGGLAKGSDVTASPLETVGALHEVPQGSTSRRDRRHRRRRAPSGHVQLVVLRPEQRAPSGRANKWKSFSFTMLDGSRPGHLDPAASSRHLRPDGLGTIEPRGGRQLRSGLDHQFRRSAASVRRQVRRPPRDAGPRNPRWGACDSRDDVRRPSIRGHVVHLDRKFFGAPPPRAAGEHQPVGAGHFPRAGPPHKATGRWSVPDTS